MKKIGFACKLSKLHPTKGIVSIPEYNNSTTTITWLKTQSKDIAVQKLYNLMESNIDAVYNLVEYVGSLEPELRMVRLGSDILPAYTHPDWSWFWRQHDVVNYCASKFSKIGNLARSRDVRLSFHPSQFCVLSSLDDDIVNRSIAEFEYHADIARWLGYGKEFQDFKINVHISGKRGPQGIISAISRLSPEARNCITIENEENSWGLDDTLQLADHCALVLDIHHHFIKSGEYIQPSDPRISRVIDSWRGVRPVIHYSVSREDLLTGYNPVTLLDLEQMLASGLNKQKLRAHSDFMWNQAVNDWAYTHWAWADVQVEAKGKNIASYELYQQWMKKEQS